MDYVPGTYKISNLNMSIRKTIIFLHQQVTSNETKNKGNHNPFANQSRVARVSRGTDNFAHEESEVPPPPPRAFYSTGEFHYLHSATTLTFLLSFYTEQVHNTYIVGWEAQGTGLPGCAEEKQRVRREYSAEGRCNNLKWRALHRAGEHNANQAGVAMATRIARVLLQPAVLPFYDHPLCPRTS